MQWTSFQCARFTVKIKKNLFENPYIAGFWEGAILFSEGKWQFKVNYDHFMHAQNN